MGYSIHLYLTFTTAESVVLLSFVAASLLTYTQCNTTFFNCINNMTIMYMYSKTSVHYTCRTIRHFCCTENDDMMR